MKDNKTDINAGDIDEENALQLLFNDIFLSYEKPLLELATQLLKNRELAYDIVHDVFMKLWEIRHQLHEIKSIESYLFILTRNKIMDQLRKVSSENRLKQNLWISLKDNSISRSDELEKKELRKHLQLAIDNLPTQRKAVYMMRELGHNYEEIAKKHNISRHTVKNHISAAIKSIRTQLIRLFS